MSCWKSQEDFLVLGLTFRLMVLMEALVHLRMILVKVIVKQTQKFAWVCIIMVVKVICLLMEKIFVYDLSVDYNFTDEYDI